MVDYFKGLALASLTADYVEARGEKNQITIEEAFMIVATVAPLVGVTFATNGAALATSLLVEVIDTCDDGEIKRSTINKLFDALCLKYNVKILEDLCTLEKAT